MNQETSISRYANVLLLIVATFVVHGHVLERFWLDDDPQVLLHATRFSPSEVVTDRAAWQELSASNFTPLVTWSFDLDLSLFGLEPGAFYVHQLLAVAFAALALRLMLIVRGTDPRTSTLAALLFLIAPPTIHVAGHLMTRHYVEGLILALLAILLWPRPDTKSGRPYGWLFGSALAYLGAILAKEVYLLLPLVLFALGIGTVPLRRLVARLAPHGILLLGYLLWRGWILGGAGGYGEGSPFVHLAEVSVSWAASHITVAVWFGVLIAVSVVVCLGRPLTGLRYVLVGLASVAPLVGVGDAIEPRHLLVPAVAALCGAVAGTARIERPAVRRIATWLAVGVGIVAAVPAWLGAVNEAEKMEAEGRYVWEEGEDAVPLLATSPGWYLEGIAELDELWRAEESPEVFYSPVGLVMFDHGERFITFDENGAPRIQHLEDRKFLDQYAPSAPIEVTIRRSGQALLWEFGPECDCSWSFYSYPDYQMFVVPPSGRRIVPRPRSLQWFRIERRERDGSWTMSPPLALPLDGEIVSWSRDDHDRMRKTSN